MAVAWMSSIVSNSVSLSAKRTLGWNRQKRVVVPYIDAFVLLLLPTLLNLSTFEKLQVSRAVVTLLFFGLFIKNCVVYSAISEPWSKMVSAGFSQLFSLQNRIFWLLVALVTLFVIADIRGGFARVVPPLAYIGFFLWACCITLYLASVVTLNTSANSQSQLLISFVLGMPLYVLLNLLGHTTGLQGPISVFDSGQNKILSLVGISAVRVAFPFASGLNNFGVFAGLTIVSSFALAIAARSRLLLVVSLLATIIGLVGAVMVDSRAPLGFAIFCCLALLFLRSSPAFAKVLYSIPWFSFLAPVIFTATAWFIQDWKLAELLGRQGDFANRLGLLSGRDAIWSSVGRLMTDLNPIHLIGYGSFGQLTSGISKDYGWVFSTIVGANVHSLHNAALQVFIEIGYFGLAVWVLFWLKLFSNLIETFHNEGVFELRLVPLAMACFVCFSGAMEVSGTTAFPDVFAVVIFLAVWTTKKQAQGNT